MEGIVRAREGPHFLSWTRSNTAVSLRIRLGLVTASDFTADVVVATMGGESIARANFSKHSGRGIHRYVLDIIVGMHGPQIYRVGGNMHAAFYKEDNSMIK